jgi:hypothetical protein
MAFRIVESWEEGAEATIISSFVAVPNLGARAFLEENGIGGVKALLVAMTKRSTRNISISLIVRCTMF